MSLLDTKWRYFYSRLNDTIFSFAEVMTTYPTILPVFFLYESQEKEFKTWLLMYGVDHDYVVVDEYGMLDEVTITSILGAKNAPYKTGVIQWR